MFKAFIMEENQNIDYKRIWKDEYLQWICGFANAQGGKLFIGIDDDKTIVGLKNVNHLLEDIPNKIVSTLGIVCDVNLHEQNGPEYVRNILGNPPSTHQVPPKHPPSWSINSFVRYRLYADNRNHGYYWFAWSQKF